MIFREPVISDRIKSVGWESNTLEIEFHGGKIYQYEQVSYPEYKNFMNAESLGRYLTARIEKIHTYKPIN